jgi:thioesterase domain-containing protein
VNYEPETYEGKVCLLRSPGHPLWCSYDEDYGWGDLANGGVAVTIVPGAHEKILEEPCVQNVAEEVRKLLALNRPAVERSKFQSSSR